jgi:hypothetical protein
MPVTTENEARSEPEEALDQSLNNLRPFTPDGSGTVIDNVIGGDGKEFFTIFTGDGDEFFLVIDRQRSFDNVYLLNTVTEEDLIALAKNNGREIVPSVPNVDAEIPATVNPTDATDTTESGDVEKPVPSEISSDNSGIIIIIIVAVLAGGAGYYFKIYRKKNAPQDIDSFEDEDDIDESEDDDWDYDHEDLMGGGDIDDGKD